jgi:ATP-dependent helicase/nuclease subunit B
MSVRFILGRSGTGKTSRCVSEIVAALDGNDERPLMFLVPEQATYQAERAILSDERIGGYDRLNVLSFERLGYLLLGKSTAKKSLSRVGRQMIVQRLLRVHTDELEVFGAAASRVGAGRAIAETIAELHQYGRSAEDIDELVETLRKADPEGVTGRKFADIALIFKEYLKFIEGKFIDPDIQLATAKKAAGDSPLVKGARLWVDGFAGFTAGELSMLAEILRSVLDASIALCVDPKTVDMSGDLARVEPTSLFGPTEKTYCELLEIIRECKLRLDKPIVLTEAKRFSNCAALGHIEKQFDEFEPQRTKAGDGVKIAAAANGRSEVRFVAREIVRLVRQKNYRYRDIAVIASDIDYYEHYLRAYLEDYAIPYFIDKRKSLRQHPVIGLVLSALAVVTEGFSRAEVFGYLKSGLSPLDNCEVDVIENYCTAFGMQHKHWQEDEAWDFAGPDDDRFDDVKADEIRRKAAEPLVNLGKGVSGDGGTKKISAEGFTKAIFHFLDRLGVPQRLNKWVEESLAAGDTEGANYHQQFCEGFADIFDEMAEAFAGVEMSCSQWREVLEAAVDQMSLAFIPPRLDQVLVGSIERSRHPDLKAVFLLGCTQKQFPSPVHYDCVLSESDRMAASGADFALGPCVRDELAQRQYLAYIAFTRAAEYLCASFPLLDRKGSANVCSRYVQQLVLMFTDLKVEQVDSGQTDINAVTSKPELAEVLCAGAGAEAQDTKQAGRFAQLINEMRSDNELNAIANSAEYALDYSNAAELDRSIAKGIFAGPVRCSATRLGSFAACPYQHFARYVLGLEERKEFKFEPLDKGLLYHKALDSLVRELNGRKIDFAEIDEQQLIEILHERIETLIRTDSFTRNFNRHSRHNAYVLSSAAESLEAFVCAAAEMMRAGDFHVKMSEVKFGDADSILGVCRLMCSGGREVTVNGVIDRIDTAQIDGKETALIFDYKSSDRSFSWARFYYGLDMQLGIYMLAARAGGLNAIGAFYVPIEAGAEGTEFAKVESRGEKFEHKGNGIFNGEYAGHIDRIVQTGWSGFYNYGVSKNDGQYGYYGTSGVLRPEDFAKFIELTKRKICEITEQMGEGTIAVSPYRLGTHIPCGWCKCRSVCRFDWQINDYRVLPAIGKAAVLEAAGGGNG